LFTYGIIVSEFPCYTFEYVTEQSFNWVRVIAAEAMRQRASKASLSADLSGRANMKDHEQRKLTKHVNTLLNPHKAVIQRPLDDSGWEALRKRR